MQRSFLLLFALAAGAAAAHAQEALPEGALEALQGSLERVLEEASGAAQALDEGEAAAHWELVAGPDGWEYHVVDGRTEDPGTFDSAAVRSLLSRTLQAAERPAEPAPEPPPAPADAPPGWQPEPVVIHEAEGGVIAVFREAPPPGLAPRVFILPTSERARTFARTLPYSERAASWLSGGRRLGRYQVWSVSSLVRRMHADRADRAEMRARLEAFAGGHELLVLRFTRP